MPPHRLFLDETILKSNGVQERTWFGLVGCFLSVEEHGRRLHATFEDMKRRFFRHHSESAPVIFHRMDMCARSPRGAFAVLRDDEKRRLWVLEERPEIAAELRKTGKVFFSQKFDFLLGHPAWNDGAQEARQRKRAEMIQSCVLKRGFRGGSSRSPGGGAMIAAIFTHKRIEQHGEGPKGFET